MSRIYPTPQRQKKHNYLHIIHIILCAVCEGSRKDRPWALFSFTARKKNLLLLFLRQETTTTPTPDCLRSNDFEN